MGYSDGDPYVELSRTLEFNSPWQPNTRLSPGTAYLFSLFMRYSYDR